jgi:hypothetical protein
LTKIGIFWFENKPSGNPFPTFLKGNFFVVAEIFDQAAVSLGHGAIKAVFLSFFCACLYVHTPEAHS